jgi:hypothetical protein
MDGIAEALLERETLGQAELTELVAEIRRPPAPGSGLTIAPDMVD